MKTRFFLFLFLLSPSFLPAVDMTDELLKSANGAYQRNDIGTASTIYEKLLAAAPDDPVLHYNLGNCMFREQDWAGAILHYEKALRVRPWWPDPAFNLKLARSRILDKEEDALANPFLAAGQWLLNRLSVNGWVWLGLLALTAVCCVVVLPVVSLLPKWGPMLKRARIAVLITGLALVALAAVQVVSFETIRSAVVMTEEVPVFSGPQSDFTLLFKVHKGTTLRLLSVDGDWAQIRLSSGYSGWLRMREIEKI
jgi:hypothetical protein